MFHGEMDSTFQRMPSEMVVGVLSFLDNCSKQNSRLVCRRWRCILDYRNSGIVCFNARIHNKASVEVLLNSSLYIRNLEVKNVELTWPTMTYSRNKFPPIRDVKLEINNSENTVITILKYGLEHTESLKISRPSFGNVDIVKLSRLLPELRWNNLSQLSLKVEIRGSRLGIRPISKIWKWDNNHVVGIERLLQLATVPNIKNLHFQLMSFEDIGITPSITRLFTKYTAFVERHANTLKGLFLTLVLLQTIIHPDISFGPTIFSTERQETIGRNLKLEFLSMIISNFSVLLYLVPPCIWKSDKLTTLVWSPFYVVSMNALRPLGVTENPIDTLIKRNKTTLVNVDITFSSDEPDIFQISWLESCTALKRLTLRKFDKVLNSKVQLPTVTSLQVYTNQPHTLENGSAWITRTFKNLEIVEIQHLTVHDNRHCEWLENLLPLKKLKQIRYNPFWNRLEFHNLVRVFCHDKSRLIFSSGIINILPHVK